VIFCNSGFEAVEAALKTALLATRKPGVVAFEGGYHGLGYGALTATHRAHFRHPFRAQLAGFARFVPFPAGAEEELQALKQVERLLRRGGIGAVLVEPVQGRGGIRIPPATFLPALRRLCDRHGALLVLDEVFTGFGRTGAWFACEHTATLPDLICLGKALTGGFPLSACVGRAGLMDAAWPEATGEAIHTSTYLGHPVGCAMALAQLAEIHRRRLVERSARLGARLLAKLRAELRAIPRGWRVRIRGQGLMVAVESLEANGRPATLPALAAMKRLLQRGVIVLPEGEASHVLALTPPLVITDRQLDRAARAVGRALAESLRGPVGPIAAKGVDG
jgi:acetylornithine/succinyldiaminopimelate/putrescine aminotransferase